MEEKIKGDFEKLTLFEKPHIFKSIAGERGETAAEADEARSYPGVRGIF